MLGDEGFLFIPMAQFCMLNTHAIYLTYVNSTGPGWLGYGVCNNFFFTATANILNSLASFGTCKQPYLKFGIDIELPDLWNEVQWYNRNCCT
jgi:hypothetical protein